MQKDKIENTLRQDFDELALIEPKLRELESAVITYVADAFIKKDFDTNDKWYGIGKHHNEGIKAEMATLVGYSADKPALRSSAAYDIAYQYLYELISTDISTNLLPEIDYKPCQSVGLFKSHERKPQPCHG
jgi:hypothetical protein